MKELYDKSVTRHAAAAVQPRPLTALCCRSAHRHRPAAAGTIGRRRELGLAEIREHIVSKELALEDFPHHRAVGRIIPIYSSARLQPTAAAPAAAAAAAAAGASSAPDVAADSVIGCYEMRHGQGSPDEQDPNAMPVTAAPLPTLTLSPVPTLPLTQILSLAPTPKLSLALRLAPRLSLALTLSLSPAANRNPD